MSVDLGLEDDNIVRSLTPLEVLNVGRGIENVPNGEQSFNVQKQGIRISLAPAVISARNASGKARSQQINIPTFPRGVSMIMWGS